MPIPPAPARLSPAKSLGYLLKSHYLADEFPGVVTATQVLRVLRRQPCNARPGGRPAEADHALRNILGASLDDAPRARTSAPFQSAGALSHHRGEPGRH